jgi:3-deoxy-manno-octulosonate cytidylyltransferase (CMP-KDO synthetase)
LTRSNVSQDFLLRFSELNSSRLEGIEKLEQLRLLENGISIQVVVTDKDSIGVDCVEDLTKVNKILADRPN